MAATSFSRHIYQRSVVTSFRGIKEMAALLFITLWKWLKNRADELVMHRKFIGSASMRLALS